MPPCSQIISFHPAFSPLPWFTRAPLFLIGAACILPLGSRAAQGLDPWRLASVISGTEPWLSFADLWPPTSSRHGVTLHISALCMGATPAQHPFRQVCRFHPRSSRTLQQCPFHYHARHRTHVVLRVKGKETSRLPDSSRSGLSTLVALSY